MRDTVYSIVKNNNNETHKQATKHHKIDFHRVCQGAGLLTFSRLESSSKITVESDDCLTHFELNTAFQDQSGKRGWTKSNCFCVSTAKTPALY